MTTKLRKNDFSWLDVSRKAQGNYLGAPSQGLLIHLDWVVSQKCLADLKQDSISDLKTKTETLRFPGFAQHWASQNTMAVSESW